MQMVITLRSDRRKKGWGEHSVANMEKSMKLQGLYIHPASFKNHTHLLPDCPQGTILEKKLQITHFSHSSASLTLLIIKESFVDHVEPGLKQSTWIWIHSYNFHHFLSVSWKGRECTGHSWEGWECTGHSLPKVPRSTLDHQVSHLNSSLRQSFLLNSYLSSANIPDHRRAKAVISAQININLDLVIVTWCTFMHKFLI